MMEQKYIVALETGSSKIRGAIGTVDTSGVLTVKAVEEERLVDGVRYGCVRNVAEVSQAITNILGRLEARDPSRRITGIYAALGGKSMVLSTCRVERRLPVETEITDTHIQQIANEARSTVLNDRDIVAVTPREFTIDGDRARTPVGTFGRNISAVYNLVSCRSQLKRNLGHVLGKTGTDVHGMVVRQLAIADLVLTREEKRLGCMLVDFGAETVTVSFYKDAVLVYLATLPMGSRNITRDITSLHHLDEKAEHLKKTVGNAMPGNSADVPADGNDYTEINNLVSARAGEIIANIAEQIKYARLSANDLPAGIVVTGGGAKLKGFNARLEQATRMSVRTGLPGSNIRIVDNRIQPVDAVDVIAILAAVAAHGKPCMEEVVADVAEPEPQDAAPVVEKPHIPTLGEDDADDPLDGLEDDDQPHRKTSKGGRLSPWVQRLKQKMAGLMEDNDDDEFSELEK